MQKSMENRTNNSLEERVWDSRLKYAVETFAKVNREYWDIWKELTNSEKISERLIGWADKIIWPFLSTMAVPVIIPIYMTRVEYSKERSGYVLKDPQNTSIRSM